jgi:hypothetical protein
MGDFVKPQKISMGWKKYNDNKTNVRSFISFLNDFFAINPNKIKK